MPTCCLCPSIQLLPTNAYLISFLIYFIIYCLCHRQLVVSIPRLSAPSYHQLGKINTMGTFLYKTAVFTVKMANHYKNHRCLIEKNVPIVFILPSRWQDGAKSLGIETTSCLCLCLPICFCSYVFCFHVNSFVYLCVRSGILVQNRPKFSKFDPSSPSTSTVVDRLKSWRVLLERN